MRVCVCGIQKCNCNTLCAIHTLTYTILHSLQERQLKGKLEKQLRDKEDYILQVLAQKRKLEEQLNVKEKEQVSLQQVSLSSYWLF